MLARISLILLGLVLFLEGCTIIPKETIAGSATDYNLIVEKSQNEILLLNIIRASERSPMYFTTSTKLTGQMSSTFGTGSILLPFAEFHGGANSVYSVSPSASYTQQPTIEVAVLNDKEFFKGILTPVDLATVQDYWQQGWPRELLLTLFVHRIKTEKGEILSGSLNSYYAPDNKIKFNKFQNYIHNLSTKLECNLVTKKIPKQIGPKLGEDLAPNMKELAALANAKLDIKKLKEPLKDKGKYQVEGAMEPSYYFECSPSDFSSEEFEISGLTSKALTDGIKNIGIGKPSSANTEEEWIKWLNELIGDPELPKKLHDNSTLKEKLDKNAPASSMAWKRINALNDAYEVSKAVYDKSKDNDDKFKMDKDLKKQNRFLLEVLYPETTPKSKKIVKVYDSGIDDEKSIEECKEECKTTCDKESADAKAKSNDKASADAKAKSNCIEECKVPTIHVTLRSPEAILYYLGEIMRAEKNSADKPQIYLCGNNEDKKVPLFVVREAETDDKSPFVTIDYKGTKYIIPRESVDGGEEKCDANNSIHVLSLVSLLISRQVKVSELPPPAGVSIGVGK